MEDITRPLQKLREELILRGYSQRTLKTYISIVQRFLYYSRSADNMDENTVRVYLLFLIQEGAARETVRLTRAALQFYFLTTAGKHLSLETVPLPKRQKPLPKVLSKEEIKSIFGQITNIKHKLLIMLAYSSGVRVSELVTIHIQDLDTEQNILTIRNGKGGKDRITIFSEGLKKELLLYLCQRKENSSYLFPGRNGHLTVKSVQKIIDLAAKKAYIGKNVTPHMLRHSFATHLLEQGTDIRYIQSLLGHTRLETTQIYTRVARTNIVKIKNPLDSL